MVSNSRNSLVRWTSPGRNKHPSRDSPLAVSGGVNFPNFNCTWIFFHAFFRRKSSLPGLADLP